MTQSPTAPSLVQPEMPYFAPMTESEGTAAEEYASYTDALEATLRGRGYRVYVSFIQDGMADTHAVLLIAKDDGTYLGKLCEGFREAAWTSPTDLPHYRRRLLRKTIDELATSLLFITTARVLGQAPRSKTRCAMITAMLAAWWDDRMFEGHSREGAWMLLGLIVSAEVLQRLRLPQQGTPVLI